MKIAVVGIGYVGLANAVLLSQYHDVVALDIDSSRVDLVNRRISPIADIDIETYLTKKTLNLVATCDKDKAYQDASFVIVATPTNYEPSLNRFDSSSVDQVIKEVATIHPSAVVVIKSTVPVGYTDSQRAMYPQMKIFFSPEFLREGKALHDNLYPSRIVVGAKSDEARLYAKLLREGAIDKRCPVLFTGSIEAEAIKLFANTYLAMRVAFFNELDTFAEVRNLASQEIINGVCLDKRIGAFYNNPSFGYGGYCLPKDTMQLLANYQNVPQNMMAAIVAANKTRKDHIAEMILHKKPKVVGIYRLVMKRHSDNFRESAILSVMRRIREKGIEVMVYEPVLTEDVFDGCLVVNDLEALIQASDIIVSNRLYPEIEAYKDKVYTRDLFGRD